MLMSIVYASVITKTSPGVICHEAGPSLSSVFMYSGSCIFDIFISDVFLDLLLAFGCGVVFAFAAISFTFCTSSVSSFSNEANKCSPKVFSGVVLPTLLLVIGGLYGGIPCAATFGFSDFLTFIINFGYTFPACFASSVPSVSSVVSIFKDFDTKFINIIVFFTIIIRVIFRFVSVFGILLSLALLQWYWLYRPLHFLPSLHHLNTDLQLQLNRFQPFHGFFSLFGLFCLLVPWSSS